MDIKSEYEDLTKKLENSLPLKAYPTRELVQELRKKGLVLTLKTELVITSVFNSGDISGIICSIESIPGGKLACALSHIIFSSGQPYYKEIIEYQIKRAKRIKRLNQQG